ncbi:MAG: transketolase [Dehalococcoidia bacterium]|nr:transketolase [Dehalococcoidia bacterium]
MANRQIDDLCVNTIRALAMDAVQQAGSGHPGTAMGLAPVAYALWTRVLRYNPANPGWPDRDRFILSAGHASILQYSMLHLTGYDLKLDELQQFRMWDSRTPGHPERGHTPGIELTTGPLGAGFAMGVGMAVAERHLAARFNRPSHDIVDHRIYGIVSDGDLMEGVASEAASLAGTLCLGRIIYVYDQNSITIDGDTAQAFTENVGARFEAYGWHVQRVADETDLDDITTALERARDDTARPSLIIVPTTIAFGSPNKAGDASAHGAPLGVEEVALTKQALGWPTAPAFHIPGEVREEMGHALERGRAVEDAWNARFDAYARDFPGAAGEWHTAIEGKLPIDWDADVPTFELGSPALASRQASGRVLNALAKRVPGLIGGSADLAESNQVVLAGETNFSASNYGGRQIRFGVREHAMGNVVNGIGLHGGARAFGATFLIFSDYMRPTIRLAALQRVPSIFVFTHDSIGLGGDGPTHQPVEHLASLRAMPGLVVIRPADSNETAEAWRIAMQRGGPTAIVLSRQALPHIEDLTAVRVGTPRGGYVAADASSGAADLVLLATGSEVALATAARARLTESGTRVRVVSMPSWELFEEQTPAYIASVLPAGIPRLSIEAASSFGWRRWVGDSGDIISLDRFGASASEKDIMQRFGFSEENVVTRAQALLARSKAR